MTGEQIREFREAFSVLDLTSNGKLHITPSAIILKIGDKSWQTDHDSRTNIDLLRDAFLAIDVDGDNLISAAEWLQVMMHNLGKTDITF